MGNKPTDSERRESGREVAAQIAALPAHGQKVEIYFNRETMSWVFPANFPMTIAAPPSAAPTAAPIASSSEVRPSRHYSGKNAPTESESSEDDVKAPGFSPVADWSLDPLPGRSKSRPKTSKSKSGTSPHVSHAISVSSTSDCTSPGSRSDVDHTSGGESGDGNRPEDASDDASLSDVGDEDVDEDVDQLVIDVDPSDKLSEEEEAPVDGTGGTAEPAPVANEDVEKVEEEPVGGIVNNAYSGLRRVVVGEENSVANDQAGDDDDDDEQQASNENNGNAPVDGDGNNDGYNDEFDENDGELFHAVVEAVIGPDLGRDRQNELANFAAHVPAAHYNGTVRVLERLRDERRSFRNRIVELRGLATPTRAERMELHDRVTFQ